GRMLNGDYGVICMRSPGSCPLQDVRPMTGGRHTAVCLLGDALVNDWQEVSGSVPAGAVSRCMTTSARTVGTEAPLSVVAGAVVAARAHRLIVVDEQHRPIGTVSCLDVLTALAHRQFGGPVETA